MFFADTNENIDDEISADSGENSPYFHQEKNTKRKEKLHDFDQLNYYTTKIPVDYGKSSYFDRLWNNGSVRTRYFMQFKRI